jgi:hypothetical protein
MCRFTGNNRNKLDGMEPWCRGGRLFERSKESSLSEIVHVAEQKEQYLHHRSEESAKESFSRRGSYNLSFLALLNRGQNCTLSVAIEIRSGHGVSQTAFRILIASIIFVIGLIDGAVVASLVEGTPQRSILSFSVVNFSRITRLHMLQSK